MSIGGIAVVLVNTTRDVLGPFNSAPNATGLLIRGICAACPGRDDLLHLSYRRARSVVRANRGTLTWENRGFLLPEWPLRSKVPPMNARNYKSDSIAREVYL
jgi:hypothetical protein